MNDKERTRQMQAEGLDYLQIAFGTALVAALVLAATWGHWWVSSGL